MRINISETKIKVNIEQKSRKSSFSMFHRKQVLKGGKPLKTDKPRKDWPRQCKTLE